MTRSQSIGASREHQEIQAGTRCHVCRFPIRESEESLAQRHTRVSHAYNSGRTTYVGPSLPTGRRSHFDCESVPERLQAFRAREIARMLDGKTLPDEAVAKLDAVLADMHPRVPVNVLPFVEPTT